MLLVRRVAVGVFRSGDGMSGEGVNCWTCEEGFANGMLSNSPDKLIQGAYINVFFNIYLYFDVVF